ncbi:MAG: DUF3817 domain-containing protein [Nocardioidaceae bacterium]|nr:MAG: DUF3817 domain-containing protein [Nocardioidaceae bacterium]
MDTLIKLYRPLALIVGVLLLVATIGSILKYGLPDGSGLQEFGESLAILWVLHGWVYMLYFVIAVLLARKAEWDLKYTLMMLAAGLVPVLIFFVERNVMRRLHTQPYPAG